MNRWLTVDAGDSVESVAYAAGHHPETLWAHSANEALRSNRRSLHVLAEGDRLFVPDIRLKSVDRPVDKTCRFRRIAVPSKLGVRIVLGNRVLTNTPCRAVFPGHGRLDLRTDSEGFVEFSVMPDVGEGQLVIMPADREPVVLQLRPRYLAPVDTRLGLQQRLRNLGYYHGPLHELLDLAVVRAVMGFQQDHGLGPTGQPDAGTRDRLRREHGC